MYVASLIERIQYLKSQPVHVRHRQQADDIIPRMDKREMVGGKLCIAPEAAIRQHYPLRIAGRARSIVQYRQLVRLLLIIMDDIGGKQRILLHQQLRQPGSRLYRFRTGGLHHAQVIQPHHQLDLRNLLFIQGTPACIRNKQRLSFRMVDDMMDIIPVKIMENRHSHRSIGQNSKERNRPIGRIRPHDSDFVFRADSRFFQKDMQLLYLPCHFFIRIGRPAEI